MLPSQERTEKIFSFGTLLDPTVQYSLFGRLLDATADKILDHQTTEVPISDPEVIRTSGKDVHLGLVRKRGNSVPGAVVTLTLDELAIADEYEVDDYARRRVITDDGGRAWCYLSADPLAVAEKITILGDLDVFITSVTGEDHTVRLPSPLAVDDSRLTVFEPPIASLEKLLALDHIDIVKCQADTVLITLDGNDLQFSRAGITPAATPDQHQGIKNLVISLESHGRRVVFMSHRRQDNWRSSASDAESNDGIESLRTWCRDTYRDFLEV